MGAFAGMLAGLSGGMEQEHREQFEGEIAKRRTLTEMFLKDASDPNNKDWHRQDALKRLGMLIQTPYNKKLPSEVLNLKDYGQRPVQVNQAPQQQQGGGTFVAPAPPPDMPGSAPGGKPAGVLQGGANDLPPAPQASSVVPPQGIPIAPMGPPPPPTYGGPPPGSPGYPMESGYTSPEDRFAKETEIRNRAALDQERASIPIEAQRSEALQKAMKVGAYKGLVEIGVPSEHAQAVVSGMAKILQPKPVQVLLDDGTTTTATRNLDPETGDYVYHKNGQPIKVVREVGLAVQPRSSIEVKNGVAVGIKRADGSLIPFGDSRLTADESAMLAEARKGATSTVSRTSTNAEGDTTVSKTSTTKGVGASPAAPPHPPGGAKPTSSASEHLTPQERRIQMIVARDAGKASADARKMVNLLDTAEAYTSAVNSGKQKPDSARDLGLIVQAVRAMNPGTVRLPQTEITLEAQRGTYGERAQRWFQSRLVDGTLPKQFRDELMGVIRDETSQVAKDAAANWQQNMGKQALPPHLKRFGTTGGGDHPAVGGVFNGKKITKVEEVK